MNTFIFKSETFREAQDADVSTLRRLVNASYKELADMGLNYTASFQDEQITRERMASGKVYLLERDGEVVGTVLLRKENWFTGKHTAYVGQLAVSLALKKQGLGSLMMDLCEDLASNQGYEAIQLDTAKPAGHLVAWYLKRGFKIVGETRFEGKTYESWIFEKPLVSKQNYQNLRVNR